MLYVNCIIDTCADVTTIVSGSQVCWGYLVSELKKVERVTRKNGKVFRIPCVNYVMDKGYVHYVVRIKDEGHKTIKDLIMSKIAKMVPDVQYDNEEQMVKARHFDTNLTEVEPGVYDAKYCGGTYFGSGSVNYNFLTNGKVEKVREEDNKFCVIEYFKVTLELGQWLFRNYSSYPGGSNGMKSLICKEVVQQAA